MPKIIVDENNNKKQYYKVINVIIDKFLDLYNKQFEQVKISLKSLLGKLFNTPRIVITQKEKNVYISKIGPTSKDGLIRKNDIKPSESLDKIGFVHLCRTEKLLNELNNLLKSKETENKQILGNNYK